MAIFYKASRTFLHGLFSAFYGHDVYLPSNVRFPKGAIIAANHASFFDPPIIAVSWPEPIHFLARKSLFEVPLLTPIIKNLNAHPLQAQNDLSSLKLACKLVGEGKKILIFPEGTRTKDGTISRFKPGVGLLAQKAKSAIIPAYIHGSFDVWSRHHTLPRAFGYKTACVFGSPIYPEEFGEGKEAQTAIANRLYEEIHSLKTAYVSGALF